MVVYWVVRLALGPLALFAAGWDGDGWLPIMVAQTVLISFALSLAPTPGASGAAELGFVSFVSPYVASGSLLSAALIWRVFTHFLQLILGAFFVGRQTLIRRGEEKEEA